MVGLPCLVIQCAKVHVAGWKWAVFTRVYLELCTWPVAILTMDQRKEQRVCVKFRANLGRSATETLTIIQQAFGDQILSRTQVFQWHAQFKPGRTSVDDDEHTGRPTRCTPPETVARIQEVFRQDRSLTIHDIAVGMGIGYGTFQRILTKELGIHRFAASPWQRPISHFHPHPIVFDKIQMAVIPHRFDSLLFLPISKGDIEAERTPVWCH
jgi:hypothetical protein